MVRTKDYITHRDLTSLRAAGFVPSFSGGSWFGVDKHGTQWQAFLPDDGDAIKFRVLTGRAPGEASIMLRTDFNDTFSYQRVSQDTGD